jgi:hypothetical protein
MHRWVEDALEGGHAVALPRMRLRQWRARSRQLSFGKGPLSKMADTLRSTGLASGAFLEHRDGRRYTCFAIDTGAGQHAWLDPQPRPDDRTGQRGKPRPGKHTRRQATPPHTKISTSMQDRLRDRT